MTARDFARSVAPHPATRASERHGASSVANRPERAGTPHCMIVPPLPGETGPGGEGALFKLALRARAASGQTTTEYLMISGFITAVGIFVIRVMQVPFQGMLARIATYVINNAADLPW